MSLPDPQARIVSLERELAWANLKIQSLMEELRQFRVKLLGPKSETLNDLQLELLADQEPGTTLDEVEAESRARAADRSAAARAEAASGTAALAGESAASRGSRAVRGADLPAVRRGNGGDRLRRERAVGCRAGAAFRAGDQAREAGLPRVARRAR